ncbi:MAG TPA: ABC transporter permease, partial [Rhodothermia bacterium]
MLRNYLKIAIRNLRRHKAFTLINVTGLAVGMAACLLIFLYVDDEISYDTYHANSDRIYRLAARVEGTSYENGIAKVPDLWGPGAKSDLSEIVEQTRFVPIGQTLIEREGRRQYEAGGMYADSATFAVFSWPLVQGHPETALVGADKVVLTSTFAKRWFGDENPIGQTLFVDNGTLLTVSGLMADVPANSHFSFDFLVSLESYHHERRGDWISWNQFYTYLLIAPSTDPASVAAKFDAVLDRHLEPDYAASYYPLLQPLPEIHLHSKLHREIAPNSDVRYVNIFSTIAIFILLIACTNFVSLATARASRRAQEVGVRKVSGANRFSLIRQFLGESIFLCALATALGWALSLFLLDGFNTLAGKDLEPEELMS